MYKCKYFIIQELVPPQVYKDRGDKAWELLDERMLQTIDAIRDHFGVSCTINNWKWGGNRQWSGLRTVESPYYSPYSQHSFGRAFDILVGNLDAEEVREEIIKFRKEKFPFISGMELCVSWLHVDCRNHAPLKVFHP